jgi:endonuclease/exonuclease/phosphatase family metal-dependent hydrolase
MSRPLRWLLVLPLAALAALAGCYPPPGGRVRGGTPGDYLFCFWNTENFFDDRRDGEKTEPDRTFDEWFAEEPEVFREKLAHLTEVLAEMNSGRGPDIIAVAEVENEHAAELLMESLNARIKGAPSYKTAVWKDPHGGRHIADAVITRLPVVGDRTRLLGRRQRMLEVHIDQNGHDLVVLATHWSSRVSDSSGEGRRHYANVIYGRFRQMYEANPRVDLLVCGDFNDNPDDPSVVEGLHATGDLEAVRAGGSPPKLYNVFARLWEEHKGGGEVGSHFYGRKAYIFDQIVVSPGMLDDIGWTCETDTARIHKHRFTDRRGRPERFGTRRDKGQRGASDHFPVTVRLKVAGGR